MNSNRENWLDIVRGLAMCMVVLGHCGNDHFMYPWLYYTHIPLFIVITGYTLSINTKWQSNSYVKSVLHKAKGIMYPYFMSGIIGIVINYFNHAIVGSKFGLKTIIYLLFSFEYSVNWFLPILFISSCLFIAIYKLSNSITRDSASIYIYIAVAIISFILLTRVRHLYYDLGWNEKGELYSLIRYRFIITKIIGRTLSFMPFVILGYFLGIFKNKIEKTKKSIIIPICLVLIAITVVVAYNHPGADMHFYKWDSSIRFYITSFLSSSSIFIIFLLTKPKLSFMEYIGNNTLIINTMHTSGIANIKKTVDLFIKEYIPFINYSFTRASLLMFIICLFVVPIFNKVFPFVFKFDEMKKMINRMVDYLSNVINSTSVNNNSKIN